MNATATLYEAMKNFAPRPKVRCAAWFSRHIVTNEGRPFDARLFPHMVSPGGPCDAVDDPNVRHIWLQWGIRMGKTAFGQFVTLYFADNQPCPMMFASISEKLAGEVVARTYATIGNCRPLRGQLRPIWRRTKERIDLRDCRVYVAWARSDATLADKDIRFGHGNEIDKWEHESTSTEGDPLGRFLSRASNHSNRKYILESSPSVRGRSRVENGFNNSWACHYYVPCPHCERYQRLILGDGKEPGGVVYEKPENGEHDRELARKTAHYKCRHCEGRIEDEHRPHMMRKGVWAPAGCTINDAEAAKAVSWYSELYRDAGGDGETDTFPWRGWAHAKWIEGEPTRNGPEAGYQISRLYDLTLSWGDIAAEYVAAQEEGKQRLRTFLNEWIAETWVEHSARYEWSQIGKRLSLQYARGTVPAAAWFLTAGVDVQESRVYYVVRAWGLGCTSWLIDWGCMTKPVDELGRSPVNSDLEQLVAILETRAWPVNGRNCGGYSQLYCAKIAVDTGHRIMDVHQFMRTRPGNRWCAVKGDASVKTGYYRASTLERNARTGEVYEGGLLQWQLNVDAYKEDVRDRWNVPDDVSGGWYLPENIMRDGGDYLRQIVNEAPVTEFNKLGVAVRRWSVVNKSIGNHYWDDEIYSRAAADFVTEGDWSINSAPLPAPAPVAPPTRDEKSRFGRGGNWIRR